jgi:hypothetical protein
MNSPGAKCAKRQLPSESRSRLQQPDVTVADSVSSNDAAPRIRRNRHRSLQPPPTQTQNRHRQKQVDFYRAPTILSRLALNQKYSQAKIRLCHHPEEASIWVAAKRKPGSAYSIRQLPVHICCMNLKRAIDPTTRELLNDLITSLIVAYPDSCRQADHKSMLPVHAAISYRAAPETISMCFMAYPESVNHLDRQGRSCFELLGQASFLPKDDDASHKTIRGILQLTADFWERAQAAAKKRLASADILGIVHPWQRPSWQ